MKKIILVTMFALATLIQTAAQTPPASGCRLFVLKRANADVAIEAVSIAEGATKVFPVNKSSDNLMLVFPWAGVGGSGEVLNLNESLLLIAQCLEGELRVRIRPSGGTERSLFNMKATDLAKYDIRVNVTGAKVKKAFLILRGEQVQIDEIGPVIDITGGKIPLGEGFGDYAVTTEVSRHEAGTSVSGEVPLEFVRSASGTSGYLFLKGKIPGGPEGDFVLDLAADTTLVTKPFLPSGIKMREAHMTAYSAKGVESWNKKDVLSGAGGKVEGGLGLADIPELRMGSAVFSGVTVSVMDSLQIANRPVAGIIGIYLLRRANTVVFGYSQKAPFGAVLKLNPKDGIQPSTAVELPFALVRDHVFVKGLVDNVAVTFIVDTGSPLSFLNVRAAQAAVLEPISKTAGSVRGLDDKRIQTTTGRARQVRLGTATYPQIEFAIADLPVFESYMGAQGNVGLLGNSFLQAFTKVEIDFDHRTLRLSK